MPTYVSYNFPIEPLIVPGDSIDQVHGTCVPQGVADAVVGIGILSFLNSTYHDPLKTYPDLVEKAKLPPGRHFRDEGH